MPTLRVHFKDTPKAKELGEKLFRFSVEKEGNYHDIRFPDSEPPLEIPQDLIECVTLKDSEVLGALRRQGVYRRAEGRLVVETHKYTKGGFFQEMEASGPTIPSVLELYSLVRQGKLWPEEDWEAPQGVPSRVNLWGPRFFRDLFGKMKIPKFSRRK